MNRKEFEDKLIDIAMLTAKIILMRCQIINFPNTLQTNWSDLVHLRH